MSPNLTLATPSANQSAQESEIENRRKKVCVLGAGTSGLTAVRHLSAAGIEVDCLERESDLGGNWNIKLPCSRVFESTHLVSSKNLTAYADHPMPEEWPEFPSHRLVLEYLQSYATRFKLRDHIEFNTGVSRVERLSDDAGAGWLVTLESGQQRHYGKLVIANGHNWSPHTPNHPGEFDGEIMHSGHYKRPDVLRGKRVLVVGGGNSGCDIAVESGQNAKMTALSLRRGYHIIPKFFHGTPIDVCGERLLIARLPLAIRRLCSRLAFFFLLGSRIGTGLPKPDHKLFESHPTVSTQLFYSLRHGDLSIRPDVKSFAGDKVQFVDGSEELFDLVLYATGYHLTFPFIDNELLNWKDGRPDLYLNVFHPEADDLFVLGMIQPDSGQWGLVDRQAKLVSRFIQANEQETASVERFRKLKCQGARREPLNYIQSPRHHVQIEHFSYRQEVDKQIKKLSNGIHATKQLA